ncbi:MAG: ABC transporter permease [Candidatus ainarchaeum sp.]|nr:ABC transporter permease [Candidatus ainarchaeum sp.]
MIADLAEYSVMNLRHRSMRSWLTIIGIVIGVFSIVVMISIAQGLDKYIRDQLSFLSDDIITVNAGSVSASTGGGLVAAARDLTESDLNALKKLPGIETGGGALAGRAKMNYRNQNISIYVDAADPVLFTEMFTWELEDGRWMRENERGAVVLGYSVAHDVFIHEVQVGQRVNIGNKSFTVVGVAKKGTALTSSMDSLVFMTKEDGREVIPEFADNTAVTEIDLKVVSGANISEVQSEVTDEMLRRHHVTEDEKDFTVMSSAYVAEQVGNITGALSLFLGGIAAISLLVGSIGIANTMLMSIMERTREIGTMKAVGARNGDIMDIFLIESGIIGIVGGVIGLVLSIVVSWGMNQFGVPSSISAEVMAGALAFSFVVGVVSGYVPARNAAELNAVEALRYE